MTRPQILIVDDDAAICDELGDGLKSYGFSVRSSTCLSDDILTVDFIPDVIILDLDMPGIDGFQAIERLGQLKCKPQLILASGHHSRIISAAAQSATAHGIHIIGELNKPYTIKAMTTLLETYQSKTVFMLHDDAERVQTLIHNGTLFSNVKVAFQSKREITTGKIVGYEALLRVSDGQQPINPEAIFVPAVSCDMQMTVTSIVLDQALAFASTLMAAGHAVPVAVNCTPAIICDPTFIQQVDSALLRRNVAPSTLLIEITEHNSLSSLAAVAAAAGRLAMRKIGIVVDDFGKGTASFEKLIDVPLSEIKIDKSFFWMSMAGEIAPSLLAEVIGFCTRRGIATTVEGIETKEHLDLARELGADYGQGYLWDRPRLADQIVAM